MGYEASTLKSVAKTADELSGSPSLSPLDRLIITQTFVVSSALAQDLEKLYEALIASNS